ncbi:hypothetical protein BKA63DRAFT_491455 [Paraphoma chrysanthemicola]|nr:hypothetical protein BKA63DRAFT_491455 [Paraphoma chrysanthemicola]
MAFVLLPQGLSYEHLSIQSVVKPYRHVRCADKLFKRTVTFDEDKLQHWGCKKAANEDGVKYTGPPKGVSTSNIAGLDQQKCYSFCTTKTAQLPNAPYQYMSIENSNICSCTSDFNFYPALDAAPESCSKGNAGNDNQRGGGLNFIDLWMVKDIETDSSTLLFLLHQVPTNDISQRHNPKHDKTLLNDQPRQYIRLAAPSHYPTNNLTRTLLVWDKEAPYERIWGYGTMRAWHGSRIMGIYNDSKNTYSLPNAQTTAMHLPRITEHIHLQYPHPASLL